MEGDGYVRRASSGLVVAALAAVLLAATAAPAQSATKPEEPAVSYKFESTVTKVPAAEVASRLTQSIAAERSTAQVVAASTCKTITGTVVANSALGEAWRYGQESTWCYTGSTITYRYSRGIVSCCGTFWSFEGNQEVTSSTGYPFTAYRMGKFCYNVPSPFGWICTNVKYPWVQQTMRANGSYSQSWGGG